MLGIRLPVNAERELARQAKALGRGKSVIAREWIIDRLERESVDGQIRRAAALIAADERASPFREGNADSVLAALDAIDGGYDWGPEGPPE